MNTCWVCQDPSCPCDCVQLSTMAEVYGRDICDVCQTVCEIDGHCERCRELEQRDDYAELADDYYDEQVAQ